MWGLTRILLRLWKLSGQNPLAGIEVMWGQLTLGARNGDMPSMLEVRRQNPLAGIEVMWGGATGLART